MKNKIVAAVLALLLGVFGVHRFYLGQKVYGILMFISAMFSILLLTAPRNPIPFIIVPAIIGLVDAVLFFVMPQKEFNKKYNSGEASTLSKASQFIYPGNKNFQNNSDPLTEYKRLGIESYRIEDYEGAIEYFNEALNYAIDDPAIHFNLACCHSFLKESEDAFRHLNSAFRFGFREPDKIQTHPALKYLRSLPEFENFMKTIGMDTSIKQDLLEQLKDEKEPNLKVQLDLLESLREKEILTLSEYQEQKKRLLENRK